MNIKCLWIIKRQYFTLVLNFCYFTLTRISLSELPHGFTITQKEQKERSIEETTKNKHHLFIYCLHFKNMLFSFEISNENNMFLKNKTKLISLEINCRRSCTNKIKLLFFWSIIFNYWNLLQKILQSLLINMFHCWHNENKNFC